MLHFLLPKSPDDPAQITIIGTVGGLGSALLTWLARQMETLDRTLALATHAVGLGVAVLTFLILLRRWRNSRREPPPREPYDVEDDLP